MIFLFFLFFLSLAVISVGGVTGRSVHYTCYCVCVCICACLQLKQGLFGDEGTASRNGVPQALNFNNSS